MSKVYIRSQDREELILFGAGFNSIYYQLRPEIKFEQNTCAHTVVATGDNVKHCLGVYESKERCLEILDEIQKECAHCYKSSSVFSVDTFLFDMPAVYQMPEK
ncbi:MAG: hypothetical protein HDR11_15335 [Lachnospiraceae bacterium]|nr:hypothetical protein [Lachnospiraceae bacterium]